MATGATFVLAYGDRFVLNQAHGPAEVGIYSLGYQFGFILYMLGAQPFLQAWNPARFSQLKLGRPERDVAYSEGLFLLTVMVGSVAVAMALGIRPAIAILAAPDYQSAAVIVPMILVAYCLQALSDAMQFGVDAAERTLYSSLVMWGAAAITVVLYLVLIPRYGTLGAAAATALGFLCRFFLMQRAAQHVFPIGYRWKRTLEAIALAGAFMVAAQFLTTAPVRLAVVAGPSLFLAYAAATWFLLLKADERSYAAGALMRLKGMVLAPRNG